MIRILETKYLRKKLRNKTVSHNKLSFFLAKALKGKIG